MGWGGWRENDDKTGSRQEELATQGRAQRDGETLFTGAYYGRAFGSLKI